MCLQHALEQELSKKETGQGAGLSATAQRAYVDTLSESLNPHSKSHGPTRVEDVIRKNEVKCNHLSSINTRLWDEVLFGGPLRHFYSAFNLSYV